MRTTYQTQSGQLLTFIDTQQWLGPYPECSWDKLYDVDMAKIRPINSIYYKIPQIIIGPPQPWCRALLVYDSDQFHKLIKSKKFDEADDLIAAETCYDIQENYQYCSKQCWYIDTASELIHNIRISSKVNCNTANKFKMMLSNLYKHFHDTINWNSYVKEL